MENVLKSDVIQLPNHAKSISCRDLELFPYEHSCYLKGEILNLTQTEFFILHILMKNCGCVVSARDMSNQIWKDAVYISRSDTIAVHIRHLREKMEDSLKPFTYIKNVWGIGYIIES